MKYHLGGSVAIGSGGLEFNDSGPQEDNPQMKVYADHMGRGAADDLSRHNENLEMELLDEAGNVSSALAIRTHNSIITLGKAVIKAKTVEEKLDILARQNVSIGGLILMSVAVSGDRSFGSLISKALSNRRI